LLAANLGLSDSEDQLSPLMEPMRKDDGAQQRYLESCVELQSAISTLENAITAFVGRDSDIQVFAATRARLEEELAASQAGGFPEADVV